MSTHQHQRSTSSNSGLESRDTSSRPRLPVVASTAPAATKCFRTCKSEKLIDDFARHHSSKDGHRHDCKDCVAGGRAKKRPARKCNGKRQVT
jgi:hypothetical protein